MGPPLSIEEVTDMRRSCVLATPAEIQADEKDRRQHKAAWEALQTKLSATELITLHREAKEASGRLI